jgi:hypothetical protein
MTTRDDFIQRLENYLHEYEGSTPLPDSVRLAVRAELPNTKQVRSLRGPARYMTMIYTRTAQVALGLAAAALILAAGAFLYSGRDVGGPLPSPTGTSPSASVAASGDATCEATTAAATGVGAETIDVTWCAYGIGEPRAISFSMEAPSEWLEQWYPGEGTLWLRPAGGGAIALALHPDQSVDQVAADVAGRDGYVVANESPVTLGGADGVVLDVSLAEGTASSDVAPLIADADQTLRLQSGTITTVWIVDVAGDTVMIAAGESLADAVGDALQTIEWER